MKRKHYTNAADEEVEEGSGKQEIHKSNGGFKLGDLICVKLHPSSWWPAQVVDADTVSILLKPSERSVGEVLVRVYGSYIYLYVDPLESRTEFDKVLKLYNGNYDQILKESLDKDRAHLSKSERLAALEATKSIEEISPEISFDASSENDNNAEVKISGTRTSDYVQNCRKLRSGTTNKSSKKNTVVVKELSLQRRISPRRMQAYKKSETNFKHGDSKSEVGSSTGVEKSCPIQQRLRSKTSDDKTARLDSENTGKVEGDLNIPYKEVVPVSVNPDASARSKRIMQNLGLIAPCGSPFNLKIRHI